MAVPGEGEGGGGRGVRGAGGRGVGGQRGRGKGVGSRGASGKGRVPNNGLYTAEFISCPWRHCSERQVALRGLIILLVYLLCTLDFPGKPCFTCCDGLYITLHVDATLFSKTKRTVDKKSINLSKSTSILTNAYNVIQSFALSQFHHYYSHYYY